MLPTWIEISNHLPPILAPALYLIGAWVAARVARLVVSSTLGRIARRSRTTLDDQLVTAINRHVGTVLVALGLHLALESLGSTFPVIQDQVLFAWALKLAATLVILGWALLANAVVIALLDWYLHSIANKNAATWDQQILPVVRKLASALILFIAGTMVLSSVFRADITGLVTTAGVASVAIALASQETLSNMISGFTVLVDRPFRVGDVIELKDGKVGEVADIGLRSTTIRQFDGNALVIPNREIAAQQIVNFALPNTMRAMRETIGVSYATDIDRAKELILDVLKNDPGIVPDPEPTVLFSGFGDSALNLLVIAWVADYRTWSRAREGVLLAILRRFRQDGIEIPFPQRDVHLFHHQKPAGGGNPPAE